LRKAQNFLSLFIFTNDIEMEIAMAKIKLCGLSRPCDIEAANELKPDYIGFVFAQKSRRYVSGDAAAHLKNMLHPKIQAVGVFVNENADSVASLLEKGIIDIAQLHGSETNDYIKRLRTLTSKPVIQAFRMDSEQDAYAANASHADYILLDSGKGGTGEVFDWRIIRKISRPYFLAGGLTIHNVGDALGLLAPYAVDVSSGIETNGYKDRAKMRAFVNAVRTQKMKNDTGKECKEK